MSQKVLLTTTCPKCGQETLIFQVKENSPHRAEGRCKCYPMGALVEMDVSALPQPKREETQKERRNVSTKRSNKDRDVGEPDK